MSRDFSRGETSTKEHHIDFDTIVIESPTGQKEYILPLNANTGSLYHQQELWYDQFVTAAEKFNEHALFIEAKFIPAAFSLLLKQKGYKVYWLEAR